MGTLRPNSCYLTLPVSAAPPPRFLQIPQEAIPAGGVATAGSHASGAVSAGPEGTPGTGCGSRATLYNQVGRHPHHSIIIPGPGFHSDSAEAEQDGSAALLPNG